MMNPYQPSHAAPSVSLTDSRPRYTTWAGGWLAGAGLFHFLAVNVLSDTRSLSELHVAPLLLVLIGWSIMYRLWPLMTFLREDGSLTTILLALVAVLLFVEPGPGHQLTYGSTTIREPNRWQYAAMIALILATLFPPWWLLHRALACEVLPPREGQDDPTSRAPRNPSK